MLWAHTDAPAGGAATEDLIPATIVAVISLIALGVVAWRYRAGGAIWLRRLAAFAGRVGGMPVWVALPAAVAAISLLSAVFGFYWDVSTHIDNGRDPGPFANPSHFFILFGLAGIALAGFLSVLIGSDSERRPTFVGFAPLGGVLLLLCGVVAVAGFPLDDVWHRLFGQDVTLWGPTHIQMVAGAALTTLAIWILVREGTDASSHESPSRFLKIRELTLGGAFLVGLSALHAEYDFGAPQFQLVYQPVLLMLAAGIGLTATRVRLGRGGALWAAIFFVALRGILAIVVGPVLGRTVPHFPLYLVEALLVEAVALRVDVKDRLRFSLTTGAAIGTIGLAAEWGWSHLWMENPWPAEMLPEGVLLGLAAALAGAVLGGFIGTALDRTGQIAKIMRPRHAFAALTIALICLAYPAPMRAPENIGATVDLEFVDYKGIESALATVRPEPAAIAEDAIWFQTLSWQGMNWDRGTKRMVDFEEIEPGVYRTLEPVPVEGEWKSLIRLHNKGYLVALPIYMPQDKAIPAEEVPATAHFQRDFVDDKQLLQREAKPGNVGLQRIGYTILVLIGLAWLAAFGWGLLRLGNNGVRGSGTKRPRLREGLVAPG